MLNDDMNKYKCFSVLRIEPETVDHVTNPRIFFVSSDYLYFMRSVLELGNID